MMNNKDIDIKVLNQLLNKEQRRYFILEGISTYAFLFLIYLCKKIEVPVSSDINAMIEAVSCDDNIKSILQEHAAVPESMTDVFWNACSEENIENLFRRLITPRSHLRAIPEPLGWLSCELLELKENDILADFTGDIEDLSAYVQKNNPVQEIHLFNANPTKNKLLSLKNYFTNKPNINFLHYIELVTPHTKLELKNNFNKIYAFLLPTIQPDMAKAYIDLIFQALKQNGKAVVVVPDNVMYSRDHYFLRRSLINDNCITRIISLPKGTAYSSNLYTSIFVLEKTDLNNKPQTVFMSDLRKYHEQFHSKTKFINPLSEFKSEVIDDLLNNKNEFYSDRVQYIDIRDNSYCFSPGVYLTSVDYYYCFFGDDDNVQIVSDNFSKTSFKLGEEADIFRSTIDSRDILKFVSNREIKDKICNPIGRYLSISDVQENQVNQDSMPYILEINKDYAKFKLTQNDLLISKTTSPVKIAVCPPETDIYPAGNFYIIRLKPESKLNRLYLKIFLESEKGQTILNNISVGATMKTISKASLEDLEIPYLNEEQQKSIRLKYNNLQKIIDRKKEEISELQKSKEFLINELFK